MPLCTRTAPPCEAVVTAMGGQQIHPTTAGLLPGRDRSQQPRERPTLKELPITTCTTSPLTHIHATQTTQCSASALPPAPRLRSPLSAPLLPAAGLLAPAQSSRALLTTLSTARGPLSSSTPLTPLVSRIPGGKEALASEERYGGWEACFGIWAEESGADGRMSKRKEETHTVALENRGDQDAQGEAIQLQIADHWNSTGTWRKLSI